MDLVDPPATNTITSLKEITMLKTTIHASPEFLNRLDWQLRRLLLLIEVVEGNAVSLGELHEALHTLLEEAQSKK